MTYDPGSTTDTFEPNERDLAYSKHRRDLVAVSSGKLKDGFMPSGLPVNNNDPLSRRDLGLEFLDVSLRADVALIERDRDNRRQKDVYRITNTSKSIIDTHLLVVARGLPRQIELVNGSGRTQAGDPYRRVFLKDGVILPGQSIVVPLVFERDRRDPRVNYSLGLLSGQGKP